MNDTDAEATRHVASLEELHQKLADAVANLQTGDQWRAYLDFASRFHRYSFNNLILIWTQRPDATAVASYRSWQAIGRQVRRGEHALRVIAPITRPPKSKAGAETAASAAADDRVKGIVGFRAVPVFDISQTDGPPVPWQPAPQLLEGEAVAGLWDALTAEVNERGYRLRRGSLTDLDGANGVTKVVEREVWVRDDVSPAQAAKTLAHELGHILLHVSEASASSGNVAIDTGGREALRCAGIREVEAESVAHLVLSHHGTDTGGYTFPYVATWAYPVAAVEGLSISDVVMRVGSRVTQAAANLIAATASDPEDTAITAIAARVAAGKAEAEDLRGRVAEHHDCVGLTVITVEERGTLLGVVADSQEFFRSNLGRSWVHPYLNGRGLGAAVEQYGIGYAPPSWTGLVDHLRSLGYDDRHIAASGISTQARTGRLIDRFRDRLTVPLHDERNDLVAFTARIRPGNSGENVPKYLNSPTTPLFRKGEVLFGLRNRAPLALAPVICEGPLDAIAVDQVARETNLGLYGAAAVGTAFTEHQARTVRTAASELPIYLAFDCDPPGLKATEAAWRTLTELSPHDVRVVELPAGSDPASHLTDHPDQLAASMRDARPAADVIVDRRIQGANAGGNVLKEVAAFRELSGYASRLPIAQRSEFLLGLARRLRIDPVDAAGLAAQCNPNIMLEQVTRQASQFSVTVDDGTARAALRAMGDDRSPTAIGTAVSVAR